MVNTKLKHNGVTVSNLSTDWKDGIALAALIASLVPGLKIMEPGDEDGDISLLQHCIRTAETHLDIPAFIDAADVQADLLDDACMMTYLSNFFRKGKKSTLLANVKEEGSVGAEGSTRSSLLSSLRLMKAEKFTQAAEALKDEVTFTEGCQEDCPPFWTTEELMTQSSSLTSTKSTNYDIVSPFQSKTSSEHEVHKAFSGNLDVTASNSDTKHSDSKISDVDSRKYEVNSRKSDVDLKILRPDTSLQLSETLQTLRSQPESENKLTKLCLVNSTPDTLALPDDGKDEKSGLNLNETSDQSQISSNLDMKADMVVLDKTPSCNNASQTESDVLYGICLESSEETLGREKQTPTVENNKHVRRLDIGAATIVNRLGPDGRESLDEFDDRIRSEVTKPDELFYSYSITTHLKTTSTEVASTSSSLIGSQILPINQREEIKQGDSYDLESKHQQRSLSRKKILVTINTKEEDSSKKTNTTSESRSKSDQSSSGKLLDKTWSCVTFGVEDSLSSPLVSDIRGSATSLPRNKYSANPDLQNAGDKWLSLPEFFLKQSESTITDSLLLQSSFLSSELFEQHVISENCLRYEYLGNPVGPSMLEPNLVSQNTSNNSGSIFKLETDRSDSLETPTRRVRRPDRRNTISGVHLGGFLIEVTTNFNSPRTTKFIMSDSENTDRLREVNRTSSLPGLTTSHYDYLNTHLEYDLLEPGLSGLKRGKTLPSTFDNTSSDAISVLCGLTSNTAGFVKCGMEGSRDLERHMTCSSDHTEAVRRSSSGERGKFEKEELEGDFFSDKLTWDKSASRTSVRFEQSNIEIDEKESSQDIHVSSSKSRNSLFGFLGDSSDAESTEVLLERVNTVIAVHGVSVNDWEKSWANGKALLALVDSKLPGLFEKFQHCPTFVILAEILEIIKKHLDIDSCVTVNEILLGDFEDSSLIDLVKNIILSTKSQHISNIEDVESMEVVQAKKFMDKLKDKHQVMQFHIQISQILSSLGVQVKNLTTDWSDGKALLRLIDRLVPGVLADGIKLPELERTRFALKEGYAYLNLPPIASPMEFAEGSSQITAYLLQYHALCDELTGTADVIKRTKDHHPPLPPKTKHWCSKTHWQPTKDLLGTRNANALSLGTLDDKPAYAKAFEQILSTDHKCMTLSYGENDTALMLTVADEKALIEKLFNRFSQFLEEKSANVKETPIVPTISKTEESSKEALYSVNDKTIFVSCNIPNSTINKVLQTLYDQFEDTSSLEFSSPLCINADSFYFCNTLVFSPEDKSAVLKMQVLKEDCGHAKIKPVLTVGRDKLVYDRVRSSVVLLTDFENEIGSAEPSERSYYCQVDDFTATNYRKNTGKEDKIISKKRKSRLSDIISKLKFTFKKKKVKRLERSISSVDSSLSTTGESKRKTKLVEKDASIKHIGLPGHKSKKSTSLTAADLTKGRRVSDVNRPPLKRSIVEIDKFKRAQTIEKRSTAVQVSLRDDKASNTSRWTQTSLRESPRIGNESSSPHSKEPKRKPHKNWPKGPSLDTSLGRVLYKNCTFNTYSCFRPRSISSDELSDHNLGHTFVTPERRFRTRQPKRVVPRCPRAPSPTFWDDSELEARPRHSCRNRFCSSRLSCSYRSETIYQGLYSSLPSDSYQGEHVKSGTKKGMVLSERVEKSSWSEQERLEINNGTDSEASICSDIGIDENISETECRLDERFSVGSSVGTEEEDKDFSIEKGSRIRSLKMDQNLSRTKIKTRDREISSNKHFQEGSKQHKWQTKGNHPRKNEAQESGTSCLSFMDYPNHSSGSTVGHLFNNKKVKQQVDIYKQNHGGFESHQLEHSQCRTEGRILKSNHGVQRSRKHLVEIILEPDPSSPCSDLPPPCRVNGKPSVCPISRFPYVPKPLPKTLSENSNHRFDNDKPNILSTFADTYPPTTTSCFAQKYPKQDDEQIVDSNLVKSSLEKACYRMCKKCNRPKKLRVDSAKP